MAEGKELEEEERRSESSDRLSELPDNVIHHIMSYLREEDIAATAVSSKTWRRVRSTHPVLNLDEFAFVNHSKHGHSSYDESRAKFIVFVYNTLQRFLQSKLRLQKFSLVVDSDETQYSYIFIDWIQFALNNNVAELDICFSNSHICIVPKIVFSSKLLTVLHLSGCELSDQNFSGKFKCESLREIILNQVGLFKNIIQCLINSFPCIVNFVLNCCEGVKILNLSNLNKLNIVEVHTNSYNEYKIDSMHIEALSLRSFKFFGGYHKCDLNLDGCRNLETVHIERVILPNFFRQNLSSNFPLLRTLFLCKCDNLGRIRIASQCLESLTLIHVEGIVDATIDTPNLRSFEYNGDLDNLFPFSFYTPRLSDATIIHFKSTLNSSVFFSKLRALMGKLSPNRILSLSISSQATFKLSGLRKFPIPQLCHVKHLKLNLHSISSTYIDIVNGILWSCHPETLSMVTSHEANNDFIEALNNEVWDRRMMWNCCKGRGIKCWRHDLKDFEIEGFSGTSYEITLPPNQNMNFKFIW